MLEHLKLISAGAGSGKTYRLTEEMSQCLTGGSVRPSGIIATTFTKRAAAELKERVRVKLLEQGMTREANELSNALIGTVHGLGVKLLRRFAYEAGVSPQVDIIADGDGQRIFNLSMAAVTSIERIRRIEELCERLSLSQNGEQYNWRREVLGLVEVIRGNNFSVDDIEHSKHNSWASLSEFLPAVSKLTLDQYHTRLKRLLKETYHSLLDQEVDTTKKTQGAAEKLRGLLQDLRQRGFLPWAEHAKLGRYHSAVGAKSRELVQNLADLAESHAQLTAFQEDLKDYQDLLFDCARDAIAEYDQYKRTRGRIDYTDMEVLVLKLLENPSVRATLKDEIDLLMVDEFQDTSPMQLAIFLRLSELASQSVWVGDPKQSIYGFRGAEPRLMAAVMDANGPIDPENIQRSCWRSREDIVYACNSLFVNAFPEFSPEAVALDPVRLRAGSKYAPKESGALSGEAGLHHWHFEPEGKGRHSIGFMQSTLAKAVKDVLANPPLVLPKGSRVERPLRAGDIAILCRSNRGCAAVAEQLSHQGLDVSIARSGLMGTAEATLLLACLKYMINPSDSLSVAEIMLFGGRRGLSEIVTDRLAFIHSQTLEKSDWGSQEPLLAYLNGLREATTEYATSELLDLILERTDLRRIAVAWGDGEQRLANIDEVRRLTVAYEDRCHRQHRAASLGGFLLYLDELIRDEADMQGASERATAVNVLTYHRSKGLEWPAVICFDLDQNLRAGTWGRAVVPDDPGAAVDLGDPLSGRWLRYWVNPYGRLSKDIPWVDTLKESDWEKDAEAQALAEEARLLYVGFTRARDYLILPTGKPGASWVDRVYARGGKETTVLSPETVETPFSWNDTDIDKTNRHYVEPKVQARSLRHHQAIPFIRGGRSGRQRHEQRMLSDEKILQLYPGSSTIDEYDYFIHPPLDPGIDLRHYGNCVSQFIQSDPGPTMASTVRLELATDLLATLEEDHEVEPASLLEIADAFRARLTELQPTAETLQFDVPLRSSQVGQQFEDCLHAVLALSERDAAIFGVFCGSDKQLRKQSALAYGKLRWQAALFERTATVTVTDLYLHMPAQGKLLAIAK